MNKVVENGLVAVIIAPEYGAGWYTWNQYNEQLLFDPILVELVKVLHNHERDTKEFDDIVTRIEKRANEIQPDGYFGAASELGIVWLPEKTAFIVQEHDGAESIMRCENVEWISA